MIQGLVPAVFPVGFQEVEVAPGGTDGDWRMANGISPYSLRVVRYIKAIALTWRP
jgi:hypothetical protein